MKNSHHLWGLSVSSGLTLTLASLFFPAVSFGQLGIPSTTHFGSESDGAGGFTSATTDPNQTWSEGADSLTMTLTGPSGLRNSSLLQQAVLDRSSGSTYTFTGTMTWAGGYADDNNRTGLMLFADGAEITSETEGLSLQWNIDRNQVAARNGLNGDFLSVTPKVGLVGADIFGETFTYEGTITYGETNIDLDFVLRDPDGTETLIFTTALAASFPGEYFGFASRNRVRNETDNDQVLDFESFSISTTVEAADPVLTSFQPIGGGDWEVTLQAKPDSSYQLRAAADLDFSKGSVVGSLFQEEGAPGLIGGVDQDLVTTDSSGIARFRMNFSDFSTNFIRVEEAL